MHITDFKQLIRLIRCCYILQILHALEWRKLHYMKYTRSHFKELGGSYLKELIGILRK